MKLSGEYLVVMEAMFSLLNQVEEFSISCLTFYSGLKEKLISNLNKI